MEAYDGLAILTTNAKASMDRAFQRRLRFVVHFPFPDAAQRERLWRAAFPPATPTEGLDIPRLAALRVAGGGVRNIALNAAFRAARDRRAVGMRDLLAAARGELAKSDKPLTEAETRGWT
jgi:ATP-dependent 26S proteasome regulatory subunit